MSEKVYASTFVGKEGDIIGSIIGEGKLCFFTADGAIPLNEMQASCTYEVELLGTVGRDNQFYVARAIERTPVPARTAAQMVAGLPPREAAPKPRDTPPKGHPMEFVTNLRKHSGQRAGTLHVPQAVWSNFEEWVGKPVSVTLRLVD